MKTFWHVTTKARLPSILKKGLLPKKEKRGQGFESSEPRIYLFKSKADMEDGIDNWLGDELPEDEPLVILKINLPDSVKVMDDPELSLSAVTVSEPIDPKFIKIEKIEETESFKQVGETMFLNKIKKVMAGAEVKITISMGNFKETFIVYETNAPIRYDYGYCIPVSEDETRLVLIPVDDAKHQVGRYESGSYWAKVAEGTTSVETITDILFKRLHSTQT